MGATAISEPTNGAQTFIDLQRPYTAHVRIVGTADLLLQAWNCEAIQEKSQSKKGSASKKTDNIESYVMRNDDGLICLPAEYLRMSIVNAAKFRQDPRSPRKSAMDLYKASILSLCPLCPLIGRDGDVMKTWDYVDRRRVQVQRNGITRSRPAMHAGWSAEVSLMCVLAEYIPPQDLHDVVTSAGKLVGVGNFRPTYGRFQVASFEVQAED